MRLNQMWTSAPGLVWTGWRRRSMIGPRNSTSSRFNGNVLKKEYLQSNTKLFCSLWKNLTRDNTRRWGWGRPQPTCRCSTGPTSKFCSRPQSLHQLNSTLFERSGWTLPLDIIAVMITYGGSNAMICHGAGVKNKTLSDLVLKWEWTFQQDQGKEHWQHFNFLINMCKRSLLLSFRLEFINAKGELQVNNHIYNKSWKIILDQSHFSADCWFTGDFKSHRWMFWTCGNRHRHHVEVGHLKFSSAQDLPKGWTRWRGPSFTQRRLWWETQSLDQGQRGSDVSTES